MFLHTFYTWIIANLLHPVFIFFAVYLIDGYPFFGTSVLEIFFLVTLYSLTFSIPCLLIGWLCFYLVSTTPLTVEAKFLTWLIAAPVLVFLEIFIILLIIGQIDAELLLYSMPGMAATGIAILVRYRQFKNFFNVNKTTNHETDLV